MNERQLILKKIKKLADSKANDAVRLALSNQETPCDVDGLDLSAVTEFKRNSNGSVELKFIDRVATLQWLLEQTGGDPKAEKLYQALEAAAGERKNPGPSEEGESL